MGVLGNKFLKKHLAKVSLKLNEKHICFYGLIDSGNSVIDPKSHKPVILISLKSLLKFMTKQDVEKFLKMKGREIDVESIGCSKFKIPIFENRIFVKIGDEVKNCSCMLGVVDQNFENGKYDCLLHRDFL